MCNYNQTDTFNSTLSVPSETSHAPVDMYICMPQGFRMGLIPHEVTAEEMIRHEDSSSEEIDEARDIVQSESLQKG